MASTTYTPPSPRPPYEDLALDGVAEDDPIGTMSEDAPEVTLVEDGALPDALTLDT